LKVILLPHNYYDEKKPFKKKNMMVPLFRNFLKVFFISYSSLKNIKNVPPSYLISLQQRYYEFPHMDFYIKLCWKRFFVLKLYKIVYHSDGSGLKFFDPVWINFLLLRSVQGCVNHLWFGFENGKFPWKMSNFSNFTFRVKRISSGQVKKYPGQSRVSSYLLQLKSMLGLGWVRSGPISVSREIIKFMGSLEITKNNMPCS